MQQNWPATLDDVLRTWNIMLGSMQCVIRKCSECANLSHQQTCGYYSQYPDSHDALLSTGWWNIPKSPLQSTCISCNKVGSLKNFTKPSSTIVFDNRTDQHMDKNNKHSRPKITS